MTKMGGKIGQAPPVVLAVITSNIEPWVDFMSVSLIDRNLDVSEFGVYHYMDKYKITTGQAYLVVIIHATCRELLSSSHYVSARDWYKSVMGVTISDLPETLRGHIGDLIRVSSRVQHENVNAEVYGSSVLAQKFRVLLAGLVA